MHRHITFKTRDGTALAGWFFPARSGATTAPCVVMTHGLSGQIAFGLADFAVALQAVGVGALLVDHRGWGLSGGLPRMEANPYLQMQDTRDAITYAATLPGVDPQRIGLWGTSLSGGTALMVAAVDRRVKSVVAVCPFVSGSAVLRRLMGDEALAVHRDAMAQARKSEMLGEPVQYRQLSTVQETLDAFGQIDPTGEWRNRISVLSYDLLLEFEPGDFVSRIAPTPLLMIVPESDTRVPTDLQLEAYQRARDPKQLLMLDGGHYDPYLRQAAAVGDATREWFVGTLVASGQGSARG